MASLKQIQIETTTGEEHNDKGNLPLSKLYENEVKRVGKFHDKATTLGFHAAKAVDHHQIDPIGQCLAQIGRAHV